MRKWIVVLLIPLVLLGFSACGNVDRDAGDAEAVLQRIVAEFEISDGVIYSDANGAPYSFSDAMTERLFSDGYGVPEFAYVVSRAAYFSRRFSEREIVVLKLCDRSHESELIALMRRRAAQKENAVVYSDGVYVYLICTDKNEEILRYLK